METIIHELPPFYRENSKILILGTMPSPKSREYGFYYMHPQNRFWKVLGDVLGEADIETIDQRKALLEKHGIALWDVLARCDIKGAADASIRNAVPNDIDIIMQRAPIRRIFATGKTAEKYYNRFLRDKLGREIICLPSTSPANCRMRYETLLEHYRIITEELQ